MSSIDVYPGDPYPFSSSSLGLDDDTGGGRAPVCPGASGNKPWSLCGAQLTGRNRAWRSPREFRGYIAR